MGEPCIQMAILAFASGALIGAGGMFFYLVGQFGKALKPVDGD